MKKLTIVLPIYNVEEYIKRCLDSIYKHQNISNDYFEVIVVDDESPDGSRVIVEEYLEYQDNIKIISQKNKGLGGARNTGIENATGKYILFLDSDDYYMSKSLGSLLDQCEKFEVDILEFGAQGVDDVGHILYNKVFKESDILGGIDYYFSRDCMNSACNKVYSTSFLKKNNLFFLEKLYIEDFEFNTRAFLLAKSVKSISLQVACFYQNNSSITRNRDKTKRIKMYSDLIEVMKHIKSLEDIYRDDDALSFIKERLSFLNVTLIYQLFKDKNTLSEYINMIRKLENLNLLYMSYRIKDRKKNYFRILLIYLYSIDNIFSFNRD